MPDDDDPRATRTARMPMPDDFCPLCGVTLNLHSGPDDCQSAEAKARTLEMFDSAWIEVKPNA